MFSILIFLNQIDQFVKKKNYRYISQFFQQVSFILSGILNLGNAYTLRSVFPTFRFTSHFWLKNYRSKKIPYLSERTPLYLKTHCPLDLRYWSRVRSVFIWAVFFSLFQVLEPAFYPVGSRKEKNSWEPLFNMLMMVKHQSI